MTEQWKTVPIGDVVEDVYDGPHATPEKTDRGPVFLGIWNLVDGRVDLSTTEHLSEADFPRWTRRVLPRAGDIVFSYETKLGCAAMLPDGLRCCLGRRMALIRPLPEKVDGRFLLYSFLGPQFQEEIRARTVPGSTVERLSLMEFPRFPIRLPPLPTQRAIAGVLGALDDKIEVNRRMARTLEAVARALFESWFVRFEHPATEAKAPNAVHWPLSPNSRVPNGWRVMTPWEAFEVNPTRSLTKESDAAYLDMSNMPTQGHTPESWVRRAVGSGMKFMNGDTLVARITPCLENGKTAFVDFLQDGEVGWGSTEYIVMRPKKPLPLVFAYCLARSDEFRTFAIRQMSGSSGRQRVPAESLRQFFLAVPPAPIAEEFGRVVEPIFGRIKSAMDENRSLSATRDALLPKLISGELMIPDAPAIMKRGG